MKPIDAVTSAVYCLLAASVTAQALDTPTFSGGDGSDQGKAVLIHAVSEAQGIRAEHRWVNEHLPGGKFAQQSLVVAAGRKFDQIDVLTPDGVTHQVYFDISEFFGKL